MAAGELHDNCTTSTAGVSKNDRVMPDDCVNRAQAMQTFSLR